MDDQSKHEMNAHYSELLRQHGDDIAALAYKTTVQQEKRFALLTDVGGIRREGSVLDVGCGLGHLCGYLRRAGWRGAYTGIDINPDMCATAQKRLPEDEFLCLDMLTENWSRTFDYVFCGAAIQHRPRYEDPQRYLQTMIAKMFSLTREALSFDIFSARVDYYDEDKLYADPAELLNFCYTLTPRVVLRNDCRPYEVLMTLYRKTDKDEWNIFSNWSVPQLRII